MMHWWVWLGEWVEIEASDVLDLEQDTTVYVLDDDEDPMDVLAAILLLSDAA